ncbi:MAG: bifunctional 4-hydroxy-2-oxoglutarate aldolase/2-dehydro-3-deoxy-phosphogluconate aldolase [Planctomycetaceae bacterium]|nr:bifunctional 4-hydroxy-2-oxoglutarate aldolase/2-dehydro-3-deoxy-phosphogluconate aldolase [Planctomycetaceae bacterium]
MTIDVSLLTKYRVIPVITIDSVELALPLADALIAGGLPLAEITFRTTVAADVISCLVKERPELIVGAGTILNAANLDTAIRAGAKFGVAPGFNREIVSLARERDWLFVPGVCTPSEIETALAAGCKLLKYFPAGALGGVPLVKAITAPYIHTGVQLIPTGGVTADNFTEYLAINGVAVCGGTWIATRDDINNRKWDLITDRCKQVTGT